MTPREQQLEEEDMEFKLATLITHNEDGCCGCWVVEYAPTTQRLYAKCNECGDHRYLTHELTRSLTPGERRWGEWK